MKNKDLLQKLKRLGFPLFEVSENLQANETISALTKSGDTGLGEGFSIILANSAKKHIFDINEIKDLLNNKKDYNTFFTLFLISIALYKFLSLRTSWVNDLFDNLKNTDKQKVVEFLKNFKNSEDFFVSKKHIDPERLKKIFNNYFNQHESNVRNIKNNYEELSLEHAMSQIFTARQKEIFLKRAHGKKMTKTEREYFYRVVKKKAIALANNDLHLLSRKAID